MKTIKFIFVFVVFTAINITSVVYINNFLEKEQTVEETYSANETDLLEEGAVLSTLLNQSIKEARMRDTVIAQQIMKLQHKLEMHKQKMPLCPDCIRSTPTKDYRYTKHGSEY